MLPDRVSNPGPLTYESGVLLIALRGPARPFKFSNFGWLFCTKGIGFVFSKCTTFVMGVYGCGIESTTVSFIELILKELEPFELS